MVFASPSISPPGQLASLCFGAALEDAGSRSGLSFTRQVALSQACSGLEKRTTQLGGKKASLASESPSYALVGDGWADSAGTILGEGLCSWHQFVQVVRWSSMQYGEGITAWGRDVGLNAEE